MSNWNYIGVDWDSGTWIAVGISDDGTFAADVYERFGTLWDERGNNAIRIVVDVPIGLCGSRDEPCGCETDSDGELFRECDSLARNVIRSRRSSVFNPPCRDVVEQAVEKNEGYAVRDDVYAKMNELNQEQTGKGLMQQGLSIAPGMSEVEETIRENDIDTEVVVEGHPEVCFRAFSERELLHSKQTAPGMAERLNLLTSCSEYAEGTWRNLAEFLGESGERTGIDDLIDALALALTACADENEYHSLPEDYLSDDRALPMRMVYRRDEPFAVGG